jgi:hypothetical protein
MILAAWSCCCPLQAAFLVGMSAADVGTGGAGGGGPAEWWAWWWRGGSDARLRVAALGTSAAAAALLPASVDGGGAGWALMHGAFTAALVALAWVRPEPFLFLGFAMGVGLGLVAPPTDWARLCGAGAAAAYAVFLGVLCAASARDGLSQPTTAVVLPVAMLVYMLGGWARGEARAAREDWVLEEGRRQETGALFAALRELVPEHMLRDLGGAAVPPHVVQAVVLRTELRGLDWSTHGGGEGGGWQALAQLHELVVRFDREVGAVVFCALACAAWVLAGNTKDSGRIDTSGSETVVPTKGQEPKLKEDRGHNAMSAEPTLDKVSHT